MREPAYNPYRDRTLHQTIQQIESTAVEEKVPFNDVIQHYDSVHGYQAVKRTDSFPRWFRNPMRFYAALSVLVFAIIMIVQVIHIIITLAKGK